MRRNFVNPTPPYASCHAPTLVETFDGALLAAWFAGAWEGHPDVTIWASRFSSGTWQPEIKIAEGDSVNKPRATWNPVLFSPNAGQLLLFYKLGTSPTSWSGLVITSLDDGATWSAPQPLPPGIIGPDRNKPILLPDGSILSPSARERKDGRWQVCFELSSDQGLTWQSIGPINDGEMIRAIQPALLTLADGSLLALGRTQEGRIFSTRSTTQGKKWTELTLTDLLNPDSAIDAITLQDGRHLLAHNPSEGPNTLDPQQGRSPLHLSLSQDGQHWKTALVLEDGPGAFAYPSLIQTRDSSIHVLYSSNRRHIRHVEIDLAELIG